MAAVNRIASKEITEGTAITKKAKERNGCCQYVAAAACKTPTLSRKRITPHVFRHTTAVHLISAGEDVTVIRSWLGHVHLETTNHYAQASLEMKRKALEQVDSKLRPTKPPRWKQDANLLAWLDSL
jgi:site-specific recombinase XerD